MKWLVKLKRGWLVTTVWFLTGTRKSLAWRFESRAMARRYARVCRTMGPEYLGAHAVPEKPVPTGAR